MTLALESTRKILLLMKISMMISITFLAPTISFSYCLLVHFLCFFSYRRKNYIHIEKGKVHLFHFLLAPFTKRMVVGSSHDSMGNNEKKESRIHIEREIHAN